jgi:uncharacterized protein (TIGR02246 family)
VNDHEAIRRALAEYCARFDDGDLEGWADLFRGDGVLCVGDRRITGRTALLGMAAEAAPGVLGRTKHLTLNSRIDVEGDTATASSDFVVLGTGPSGPRVEGAGRYDDRLTREDGRWRFAERRATSGRGWSAR